MRLGGPRASHPPRRGRGLVGARAGCLERSGTRSATRSSRLSERRRSTSEAVSGPTAASRSLCEAANAVARASSSSFSCGRCRSRVPAPAPRAWVARPPPTHRPLPTSPPGADRDRQRSPPPNDARGTVSLRAFEVPQAGTILCEGGTLDELANYFVDYRDGNRRLVGIDPDQDLHARTHLRSVRISTIALACVKDMPTSSSAALSHTSFESLPHAAVASGTQA